MAQKYRLEKDALGTFKVPADAYWGIHTGRAIENFPISGRPVHPRLIEAYIEIKRAAASVNERAGLLAARPARAIRAACDDALAGKLAGQFVVDMYQAGAGTSTNMNVNEVICNRALIHLHKLKGDYAFLHPNDHVNLSQSTNDTYPAALRLAALASLPGFYAEAMKLAASFFRLGRRYGKTIKSGRTHLTDAVPVTLGGEFRAYASALRASLKMLKKTAAALTELGLGGTGTGTGLNAPAGFPAKICRELAKRTRFKLRPASDLQKAMQSQAPAGDTAAALRGFALELGRIARRRRQAGRGQGQPGDPIASDAGQHGQACGGVAMAPACRAQPGRGSRARALQVVRSRFVIGHSFAIGHSSFAIILHSDYIPFVEDLPLPLGGKLFRIWVCDIESLLSGLETGSSHSDYHRGTSTVNSGPAAGEPPSLAWP